MMLASCPEYVPIERLRAVAAEDLILTDEEFDHLKECSACFRDWVEAMKQTLDQPRPANLQSRENEL
jgi:predicted anti-sigma-YlaC factor YlaD